MQSVEQQNHSMHLQAMNASYCAITLPMRSCLGHSNLSTYFIEMHLIIWVADQIQFAINKDQHKLRRRLMQHIPALMKNVLHIGNFRLVFESRNVTIHVAYKMYSSFLLSNTLKCVHLDVLGIQINSLHFHVCNFDYVSFCRWMKSNIKSKINVSLLSNQNKISFR